MNCICFIAWVGNTNIKYHLIKIVYKNADKIFQWIKVKLFVIIPPPFLIEKIHLLGIQYWNYIFNVVLSQNIDIIFLKYFPFCMHSDSIQEFQNNMKMLHLFEKRFAFLMEEYHSIAIVSKRFIQNVFH